MKTIIIFIGLIAWGWAAEDCPQVMNSMRQCVEGIKNSVPDPREELDKKMDGVFQQCLGDRASQCLADIKRERQQQNAQKQASSSCRTQVDNNFSRYASAEQTCFKQYPLGSNSNPGMESDIFSMPFHSVSKRQTRPSPQGQGQGMPFPGMMQPQGGMPQGGMPQGGMPQGGMPQGGMPQGGMPPPPLPPASCRTTNETQIRCMQTETRKMMENAPQMPDVGARIQSECENQFGERAHKCRLAPEDEQLCNCLCQAGKKKQQDFEACMQQQNVTPPPNRPPEPTCDQICRPQQPFGGNGFGGMPQVSVGLPFGGAGGPGSGAGFGLPQIQFGPMNGNQGFNNAPNGNNPYPPFPNFPNGNGNSNGPFPFPGNSNQPKGPTRGNSN